MSLQTFLHTIDRISTWVGKATAWLMVVLMIVVCVEVFKRYILNAPTSWIFSAEYIMYGTMFMMAGAYTLAQNGHVRGDFLYGSMRPRSQASLDLILYIVFFLPGMAALVYAGWDFAYASWIIHEHVNDTADGPPVYHFKMVIPVAGALVDKMFYSVQLAFRRVPASLAVATLFICTFWGIASGLVGAVVVLMGVIAFNPMLRAGYDVRLASGVITAGGTLGILIPPSVMIIVYAAVAGQSAVKLYAAAMFPGFFLAFLYLVYIIGWALINPKIAPPLPESETRVPIPAWAPELQRAYSPNMLAALGKALLAPARASSINTGSLRLSYPRLLANFAAALVPLAMMAVTLWGVWWYVVIHQRASAEEIAAASTLQQPAKSLSAHPSGLEELGTGGTGSDTGSGGDSGLEELGAGRGKASSGSAEGGGLEQLGSPKLLEGPAPPAAAGPSEAFYIWFAVAVAFAAIAAGYYYWKLDAEQFEILKLLTSSVMPLGILTFVVLAVILLGITTATESAGIGAAGAFLLALQARTLTWRRVKESVFLTAKTTAMVCWLFVGSALFSAVFALHGGQQLVEQWVLALNMTPVQFMMLSQALIFLLGWPLEWTEIIVIFVPIFLPILKHFDIDPILWGTLVFVNLQAAFLSPPVAMSAFYLKGVSPPHVTLNQIFAGMMPYMLIVILCMVFMYVWPGMTLWLPNYLYGG
jgi:TRAP-type mannitol/chloroaromatic compound transport system permease large subunit